MFDFNYNDFSGVACKRVGIPAVIGQLLVGIVLGPMLNIVHQDVFVHDFSEIGVIMLMFILWNGM